MPEQLIGPMAKVFDCGHGRRVRVSLPRGLGSVAFVTISDQNRNHDLLKDRDSPAITLTCEGTLVGECVSVIAGTISPQHFADVILGRHPKLQQSEWRRSVVRDFCSVAVPQDPHRAIIEALGIE